MVDSRCKLEYCYTRMVCSWSVSNLVHSDPVGAMVIVVGTAVDAVVDGCDLGYL